MNAEAFDVERLRQAVLAAWTQHPVRFREDANTEEDHARGYYRDRVVVELAQNAADAATRAGVAGRLLLRLVTSGKQATLVAANTGAPLDAEGVVSLASLRASAKRDQAGAPVGRFGVGFAAVRSVSDEITVASRTGAVHFSVPEAAAALEGPGARVAELGDELARRDRWLPALRLPFGGPAPAHPDRLPDLEAEGWDTAVALTLRDADAVARVRDQLRVGDDLLLALPALARILVQIDDGPPRVLEDVADRWVIASASGVLDPSLLADRPVEERARTGWQITWAVRRDGGPGGAGVAHAPTPTDEPCTVPAMLIGTFPLDATRRHVAPGRLTDALVAHAGEVWADLLTRCTDPAAPDPLSLLPVGLPAGGLDAALRQVVLAATRRTPLLPPAGGGSLRAPDDAIVLLGPPASDPAVVAALGAWWPALVVTPHPAVAIRLLEIATAELSELIEGLPDLSPRQTRDLCDVFGSPDPATIEELAMLPVPLADGRTVRGPRGVVQVEPGAVEAEVLVALGRWGLRIVHPDAVHPLLERLGADHGDAAGLLGHPVVRERVLGDDEELEGGMDDDAPGAPRLDVTEVVLRLVTNALRTGELHREPWWGEVLLPAHDGEPVPASGLTLPGSDAAAWLDPDVLPPAHPALVERWGAEVLGAVGVRSDLRVVAADDEAPDWARYRAEVLAGDEPDGVVVVADLDAVRRDAWGPVLASLARGPARRALEPVRLDARTGVRVVPAYTTWWVRRQLSLRVPFALAGSRPHPLSAVLRPAPDVLAGLDPGAQRWFGGVGGPEDLEPDDWAELLSGVGLGDPIDLPVAVAAWRAIVGHVRAGRPGWDDVGALPALVGPDVAALVSADDVAVGSTMWAQHPDVAPLIVVPSGEVTAVADALDLDLADERAPGRVTSHGQEADTPTAVTTVFPDAPATWVEHDDLRVDGAAVDWWVRDGTVHAATTAGLARGLADAVGVGAPDRVARLVTDPHAVAHVLLDLAGDGPGRAAR